MCVLDGLIPSFIKAEVSPISLRWQIASSSFSQTQTFRLVRNRRQLTVMITPSPDQTFAMDFKATTMNRDEMSKSPALTVQIFLLLGSAIICIAARSFMRCRQHGWKNLGLEDVLAVAGVVCPAVLFLFAWLICVLTLVLALLCSQHCFGVPCEHHDTLDQQPECPGERFHWDSAKQQQTPIDVITQSLLSCPCHCNAN